VVFDLGFDATSVIDFSTVSIQLVDSQAETPIEREKNKRFFDFEENLWNPSGLQIFLKYVVDIYLGLSFCQILCPTFIEIFLLFFFASSPFPFPFPLSLFPFRLLSNFLSLHLLDDSNVSWSMHLVFSVI